jgi:soluble lytic murein transglycosylase
MIWDEAHWSAALAKRKLSRFDDSADLLEEALSRTRNANSEVKFLFWAAQGEFDSGRRANATANWQRLAQTDPHGFYGFMAHFKLGLPLQPLVPTDLSNVAKPSTMKDADYEILLWLTYSEETILAQKYSKVIMSPTSVEVEDLVMRAFIHDFVTINSLVFTRIPAAQRNQFTNDHGSLFYPRPYNDIVREAVSHFPRIDEEYVYAVMRQESGFNTYARSWANAYGLIQLLPQVARDVQDEAGVYFTEDYELFRPEINLPLGAAHMDELIDQAGASFIMRTSAYNAKVEKALEWKERLYNGNIHEFLEEIPYDETRSYIRLVMRNYVMNKRLSATQPFLFPAHLLSL